MFTLPPRPPSDYFLEEVTKSQASAPEFSPSAHPRATQTSIGLYCAPVAADDNKPADPSEVEVVHDRVLDRWTKLARADWVDKPGANAYFVHDLHKKYSVVVNPEFDERYQHKPKVFQRSYKYEFECMEYARLQKLWSRLAQEETLEDERKPKILSQEDKDKESSLYEPPPFWWKEGAQVTQKGISNVCEDWKTFLAKPRESFRVGKMKRWQEQPKLIDAKQDDVDMRREEMIRWGQPYKHEACLWYFKNYPPPKVKFIPEKFS